MRGVGAGAGADGERVGCEVCSEEREEHAGQEGEEKADDIPMVRSIALSKYEWRWRWDVLFDVGVEIRLVG